MNTHNHHLYHLVTTALLLFAVSGIAEAVPPGRPFQELDTRITALEQAPAARQPMAVDGNGVVIGAVIGTRNDVWNNVILTVLNEQGFQVTMSASSGQLSPFTMFQFFTDDANCTVGPNGPYLRIVPRTVFRFSFADPDLYYVPGDAPYTLAADIPAEAWYSRDSSGNCGGPFSFSDSPWTLTPQYFSNDPAVTGIEYTDPERDRYMPPISIEWVR